MKISRFCLFKTERKGYTEFCENKDFPEIKINQCDEEVSIQEGYRDEDEGGPSPCVHEEDLDYDQESDYDDKNSDYKDKLNKKFPGSSWTGRYTEKIDEYKRKVFVRKSRNIHTMKEKDKKLSNKPI